jgi:anhydro-N-acetylmuramic acid kinase
MAAAGRPERRIVGLMSGTSLDGLDIALCRIAGHGPATRVTVEQWLTTPYTPAQREYLRGVVSVDTVSLAALTRLHGWLGELHGRMVLAALDGWGVRPETVDAVASHGQTVFHAPAAQVAAPAPQGGAPAAPDAGGEPASRHATLQIGDGDRLAVVTGLATFSDFRQKEIAGGGQGAPLAPYVDALLFGGVPQARVLLNLGGIANITWLPGSASHAAPVAGDTGPANTLIDWAVRRHFPQAQGFDPEGRLAAEGRVHAGLLTALAAHPFFAQPLPKSTGPELFSPALVERALFDAGAAGLSGHDLVATLTRLTVDTVAQAIRRVVGDTAALELLVSGGGLHNRTLREGLEQALPGIRWRELAALGIPPDAKEAVLFAVLANEALAGAGFAVPFGSGGRPLGFGKLSLPD